eukprot:COSAG01_NODE_4188_length_5258_cov_53.863927_5_plen_71_part_00
MLEPRGIVRLRLEQGWVSATGMDGSRILEPVDPHDGARAAPCPPPAPRQFVAVTRIRVPYLCHGCSCARN